MDDKRFKHVETTVKWVVIVALWTFITLAVVGAYALIDLAF